MIQVKHPTITGVTKYVDDDAVEFWLKQGWLRSESSADASPAEPRAKNATSRKRTQPKKG